MRRGELRLRIDVLLLGASLLTFASGLVLLLAFHVGDGRQRAASLGLSRLAWLNLHRLPALAVAAGLAVHVALDWRAFLARLRRGPSRDRAERILYVSFVTCTLAGLGAWLLAGGGPPLAGPAPTGSLPHRVHDLIDVHHVAGLVALPLAAHHVGHRWRMILRGVGRRGATARPTAGRP